MANDIENLRKQIDDIDRSILELIKKRTDVASEIGLIKVSHTQPVRNFAREKICMDNARRIAAELDLSAQIAEEVQLSLIRASLASQEQDRVRMTSTKDFKKAAVIGGCGKMGNWFAQFLSSQGFQIDVLDPHATHPDFAHIHSLDAAIDHDVIVVAAPLHASNQILIQLAHLRPKGLVFDIASLKGPLKEGLMAVATAHIKATSMHPMFGPDTQLLSGRHVVIVDLGNLAANDEAAHLFSPTMATIVRMDAEDHDRNMAYLLGLSHAVNIVFSKVLASSGDIAPWLFKLSSTTFDAQLSVASRVAMESPQLYFEIQALNPFGDVTLQMLEAAAIEFREVVKTKDEARFVALMQAGQDYFKITQKKKENLNDVD